MRRFLAIGLFLFLAGCATYQSVPFEQSTAQPIKKIGLLSPSIPNEPTALLATTVGQSFGLLGAIIDASMASARANSLNSVLTSNKFYIRQEVEGRLVAALEEQGYEVVLVEAARSSKRDFVSTYPSTEPVDAYLDVVMPAYGYASAGIGSSSPWRPFAMMKTRLVRASDKTVLMREDVAYNRLTDRNDDTVTISADPSFQYADFSGLESNSERSAEGVRVAVTEASNTVGKLLR
ncbi:MAG: hypothetical protein ACFB0Z_11945 [Candidatus Phaeomarinobacter sp.]